MKPDDQHQSDIIVTGWMSRIPVPFQNYAILARLDRPIGWWLLLLPGWWAILLLHNNVIQTGKLLLLFWLGAIIMRGAGCVVNDLWDRDLDKMVDDIQWEYDRMGTDGKHYFDILKNAKI